MERYCLAGRIGGDASIVGMGLIESRVNVDPSLSGHP